MNRGNININIIDRDEMMDDVMSYERRGREGGEVMHISCMYGLELVDTVVHAVDM